MLATQTARATAASDGNKSVSLVTLTSSGSGYLSAPKVYVDLPTEGTDSSVDYELAYVSSEVNASTGLVTGLIVEGPGKGYSTPPKIKIEGGIHFLRCAESGSVHEGKFYLVQANTADTITLANPLVTTFLKSLRMILWSKSSKRGRWLFVRIRVHFFKRRKFIGCRLRYLLKPPSQQDGTTADYKPYFHDGVTWKEVGGSGSDASETVIYPDESFMIARRGNTPLDIVLSGTVLTQNTFFKIPQQGKDCS